MFLFPSNQINVHQVSEITWIGPAINLKNIDTSNCTQSQQRQNETGTFLMGF